MSSKAPVLIICDRGAMDPSAYIDHNSWEKMLTELGEDQFSMREGRYDQVKFHYCCCPKLSLYQLLAIDSFICDSSSKFL